MLIVSPLLRQCIRLIPLFTGRLGHGSAPPGGMRREPGKLTSPGTGKKAKLLFCMELQSSGDRELSLNAVQELMKDAWN